MPAYGVSTGAPLPFPRPLSLPSTSTRSPRSRNSSGAPGAPPSSRGYPRRTFRRPRVRGSRRPIESPDDCRVPLEVGGRELGEHAIDITAVVGICHSLCNVHFVSRHLHRVSRSHDAAAFGAEPCARHAVSAAPAIGQLLDTPRAGRRCTARGCRGSPTASAGECYKCGVAHLQESAAPLTLRQRREAIVREHMESENRHDFDATIATFAHPRYEMIPTGEVYDGEERCAATTRARARRSPTSATS